MILLAQPQQVISSAGSAFENSSGSISFTIGECITNTFSSSSMILTQGFHQPKLVIIDNLTDELFDIDIIAFPNPAKEFVILRIEEFQGFSYALYDLTGGVIEKNEIFSSETEIDFNILVPSTYVLKVINNREEIRTFKIIKH
jgi:hypothetical protein